MPDAALSHCRVCGLEWPEPPWGPDGDLPSFEICPCCGAEAGYEDSTVASTHRYRKLWLARGAPWSIPDVAADGLTTAERLAQVPPEFR